VYGADIIVSGAQTVGDGVRTMLMTIAVYVSGCSRGWQGSGGTAQYRSEM
jgi:hypothetical protein